MKTRITILGCLLGMVYVNAQITLDENNVPHSTTYTEDRDYIFNDIALPLEGEDQIYDYSTLSLPTTTITREYVPVTRPEFSNSTRYQLGIGSVGPIAITNEYYYLKDATGLYETGSYVLPSSQNLEAVTGNANDFIEFPGNPAVFAEPSADLLFPATFGTEAVSDFDFVTNFELTVAAFGLSATPGQNVQSVVKTTEVVGYGQLILPVPNGQSIPYDVLLVKYEQNITNNVFLGGAPAPPALLAAFGVTQGQVSTLSEYRFYAADYEVPILTLLMNEDFSEVDQLFYDMDLLETLGVANNEFANNLKMFPNPAKGLVRIAQNNSLELIKQVAIYDLSGREIKSLDENNFNQDAIVINVSDLSNGTYIIKINSESYFATKKLMINN